MEDKYLGKTSYYVDIPNSSNPENSWVNVGIFKSKEEAIKYIKNTFGGDDEGRISLITKV